MLEVYHKKNFAALKHHYNDMKWGKNLARLGDDGKGGLTLIHSCDNLLDALHVQFGEWVMLKEKLQKCSECGEWYRGRKSIEGKRPFCSDAHAKKFNNRLVAERSKKK